MIENSKKKSKLVNVTAYEVRLKSSVTGEEIYLPPSGVLINAKIEDKVVHSNGHSDEDVTFIKKEYKTEEHTTARLEAIETENPNCIVIGSIIAAQAYPGRVYALEPYTGFERVPVANKIFFSDKFQVF